MPDGRLYFACGSSRSGKTAWVKQRMGKAPAALVWDVEGQYSDVCPIVTRSRVELVELLRGGAAGRVAFVPGSLAEFDFWARVAFAWTRARRSKAVVVAEELADVTTPGKAPPGWGILVRRGLKYNTDIYAITQRPAESDKTAIGNASVIHCGRLARRPDRQYMAAELDISVTEIPTAPLKWVERDDHGRITRGELKFYPYVT